MSVRYVFGFCLGVLTFYFVQMVWEYIAILNQNRRREKLSAKIADEWES